jgi:tetratricopeptide (TPR) repeat protein
MMPALRFLSLFIATLALGLCYSAAAADPEPVLYLHTEFFPYDDPHASPIAQRLDRELVRQALLIAARHELGVECYDETLDEQAPEGDHVVHLIVSERGSFKGSWNIKLYRYPADGNWRGGEPLWEKDYKTSRAGSKHYASFAPMLEKESRGAFVEALQTAGLEKRTPEEKPDPAKTPKPAKGKASLDEMMERVDFVAQFGAVYQLHTELSARGETPELVQQLARAYAQLSMLTGHTWNASTEAFAARAMLYAQRSVVATDSSSDSLWTRAYTYALTGSLQHAEKDLKKLGVALAKSTSSADADESELSEGEKKEEDAAASDGPAWRERLVPYVLCDRQKLQQLADRDKRHAPWALELDFQLAMAFRYPKWMFDAAGKLFQTTPTAYHAAVELANRTVDLRASRAGAQYGPASLGRSLPVSLGTLPQLPMAVEGQLPLDGVRRAMLAIAVKDPDPNDNFSPFPSHIAETIRKASPLERSNGLSLGVLAYLIEEEQFVMAAAACKVSQNATESDHSEMVDAILPFVDGHRYASYIEGYRYNPRTQFEDRKKALKDIEIRDARGNMLYLIKAVREVYPGDKSQAFAAWKQSARNFTMQGSLEKIYLTDHGTYNNYTPADLRMLGGELSRIAPHLEVSTRLIIEGAEQPKVEDLVKWEGMVKTDPDAFAMLAAHHVAQDRIPDAIRCYERSLEIFPTLANARKLASLHWNRKEVDKWQAVLEGFLEEAHDISLDHAQVKAQLASGYAHFGEYRKAYPLASEAAETYSGWGLLGASSICEALGEWEESEHWARACSESYPTYSGHQWYFWCRRTGRGDVESAGQLAEQFFHRYRTSQPTRDIHVLRGVYAYLKEDYEESRDHFRLADQAEAEPSSYCSFMLVRLGRLLDEEAPPEVLERTKSTLEERMETLPRASYAWEAGLAVVGLVGTEEASADQLAQLDDKLSKVVDDPRRSGYCYFAACELDRLGLTDEAERYWRVAMTLPGADPIYATLAGSELATRFGTSRGDGELTSDDIWPKRSWPGGENR